MDTAALCSHTDQSSLIASWAPVALSFSRGTEGQALEGTVSTMSSDFLEIPASLARTGLCLERPLPREGKAPCMREPVSYHSSSRAKGVCPHAQPGLSE